MSQKQKTAGQRLTELREALRLSYKDLADSIGVNQNSIQGWEFGRYDLLMMHAKKIEACHGVSAEWLMNGTGEMMAPKASRPRTYEEWKTVPA
jgi:transcriptional regulator with XRE-family HTH domain